jgi:hypothetical protein
MEHGETWELCVCVQDKLGQMLAANLLGTESERRSARRRRRCRGRAGQHPGRRPGGRIVRQGRGCQIGIPVVAIESGRAVADRLAQSTCRANLLTEEGYALAVALVTKGGA